MRSGSLLIFAQVRGELGRILGRGVLFAEGDDHRRQRRAMQVRLTPLARADGQPAFNKPQTDALVPLFFEQSQRLLPVWEAEADKAGADGPVIDVSKGLSRLTLDIIGLAGFGTQFNCASKRRERGSRDSSRRASQNFAPGRRVLEDVQRILAWLPAVSRASAILCAP